MPATRNGPLARSSAPTTSATAQMHRTMNSVRLGPIRSTRRPQMNADTMADRVRPSRTMFDSDFEKPTALTANRVMIVTLVFSASV